MLTIVIYIILGVVLLMLLHVAKNFEQITGYEEEDETGETKIGRVKVLLNAGIIVVVTGILVHTYFAVRGTPWEAHMFEWLNIVVRLMHITFGIAWIGASFYFVFLENALNRTKNVRDELAGNLWAVHGGGFYYLEKYKVAPKTIPRELHWFKYEAYFTWLSGFSLLFVVYYFNAKAFLIDDNVMRMSSIVAIAIGIGSFIVAWIIYDLLCRSRLSKYPVLFLITGTIIAATFAWFYCNVFNARAAYIHFGAMLGSLMAGNVFFNIIPSQKAMVRSAKNGLALDATLGKKAGMRSLHNNYFTLPVLFVMVSNHFPSTFGYSSPWLILFIITLGTAGVKHYLNLKEKKQLNIWVLPVSIVVLLAAAFISAPAKDPAACKMEVSMSQVYSIVQARCITCHSSRPTDENFKSPPNGVAYDTPEQIANLKDKILQRVVITKTMPQNNKTGMTEEERQLIDCWIRQGGKNK